MGLYFCVSIFSLSSKDRLMCLYLYLLGLNIWNCLEPKKQQVLGLEIYFILQIQDFILPIMSGHDAHADGQLLSAENSGDKRRSRKELRIVLRQNALVILTLFGVILGFGLGFGVRPLELSDTGLMWLGKIFRIISHSNNIVSALPYFMTFVVIIIVVISNYISFIYIFFFG